MEYNREYWQPRIATNPNRFRKLNESNDYVELINEPESITQAGTAFTADRLNNMEAGIEGAVAGVNEIQGVLDFTNSTETFELAVSTELNIYGITTLGSDVYACVYNGDIYKQTGGVGDFIALGQASRKWYAMTTLGSDVYACVDSGDIYKQTNGVGDFIALGQTTKLWRAMTTLGSDIYACVNNGDIYKQTNGVGDFVALGQASRKWYGMTTLGSDVYACVYDGDIYKQTGGVGDFIALGQTTRPWRGITTLGSDVYACVYDGDIYKQTGGVGDFVALGQTTKLWRAMTTLGNVLYALESGGIYTAAVLTGNTFRASSSFTLSAMPDGARKRILNTHTTNAITVTANSGTTIERQATMTLSAGHEVELELIGTDWRKVVLSQSATPEAGKAMVWPDSGFNADTATAPLYQWKKVINDLYRYVDGESPDITYYWYKVCKITTTMTFDIEVVSDNNHPYRASYRLSVSPYQRTFSAYTVALLNLGQTVAGDASLAVAIDADGFLYIQTNCLWACSLHVTLLYSASSNFSITMGKLGYAPFGTESGFTPVKIITQTGAFRWSTIDGITNSSTPIINTNIIGNLTGEASKIPFATKTGTSTGTQGQASFDANYLYLCTATDVWKRVALTSF